MSTDLDLGLRHDDDPEAPPGRRRRAQLTRIGHAVVVITVLLGLVVVVAGGVIGVRSLARLTAPADYAGGGTGSVLVQVRTGDSASDIGHTLADQDVVKSADAFTRTADANDRSRSIQPGYYRLHRQMKASVALALLLDPAAKVSSKVTVPEGSPLATVLTAIARNARIPIGNLRAAARRPAALGLPTACGGQLEGCLFPATYLFAPGTSATDALTQMVHRFGQAANEVRLETGARALRRTPYQVLTIASTLEKEARLPGDFPKVARVVYNRLARGMPLQLDSTLNYVLPIRKGHLSLRDLTNPSRYNTYRHRGLPPTPIDSPGIVALEAALHPSPGPWRYFVTLDRAGHTGFAATYAGFLKLRAKSTVL